ncbi:hypothetical protein IWQ62_004258 [Dispira parvispora]|uniref:Uncharacterized protein n=1 Tax=Dispira parvispora TaxID=1520584 RepID=A0A9W8E5K5_9FUNG|nr:hypothetical protein IWQ62_004258 [Dispira parvispora]
MVRIFWSLVAVATCALTSVSADEIIQGLDGNYYAIPRDGGICGKKYGNTSLPTVAKLGHFCTNAGFNHQDVCYATPIEDYLSYSQDYLQNGRILLIGCTEKTSDNSIRDLEFQRHYLTKSDGGENDECVESSRLDIPFLCRDGNHIYATYSPGDYNSEVSFKLLQGARKAHMKIGTYTDSKLEDASRKYRARVCNGRVCTAGSH